MGGRGPPILLAQHETMWAASLKTNIRLTKLTVLECSVFVSRYDFYAQGIRHKILRKNETDRFTDTVNPDSGFAFVGRHVVG